MKINKEELSKLLELIGDTQMAEIDCDEFLSRVPAYVEKLASGKLTQVGFEELAYHLKVCPECSEEFESLCSLYNEDSNIE